MLEKPSSVLPGPLTWIMRVRRTTGYLGRRIADGQEIRRTGGAERDHHARRCADTETIDNTAAVHLNGPAIVQRNTGSVVNAIGQCDTVNQQNRASAADNDRISLRKTAEGARVFHFKCATRT